MYGYNGKSMVYLKPLYSRLDRLAKRQGRQLSTEPQQEHVKILFFKILYVFIKKVQNSKILSFYNNTTMAQTS